MYIVRIALMNLMFGGQNNSPRGIAFPDMYITAYFALAGGILCIIQSFAMVFSAIISDWMCRKKIKEKYDKHRGLLELSRDAKINAIAVHGLDIVIIMMRIRSFPKFFFITFLKKKKRSSTLFTSSTALATTWDSSKFTR